MRIPIPLNEHCFLLAQDLWPVRCPSGRREDGGSVEAVSFIRNDRYVGAVFLAMDGSSLRRFGILQQAHAGHASLRAIQKWRRDGRGGIRPATPTLSLCERKQLGSTA